MQIIINTLISAGYYALVAVGFGMLFRVFRYVDFSLGILVAVAGYTAYVMVEVMHLGSWLAGLIACFVGVGLASILHHCVTVPLIRRNATPSALMLSSLGLFILFQNLISLSWGDATRVVNLGEVSHALMPYGAGVTTTQVVVIFLPCVFSAGLAGIIRMTSLGKQIRGVTSDVSLAQIVGIPVARIRMSVVIFSAIGPSLAGIIYLYDVGISPRMGMQPLLMGIVASIIGRNTIAGALWGALFLAIAQQFVGMWLEIKWQDAVAFAILIIALLLQLRNRTAKQQEPPWTTGYTS